jgi:hypothetical protein
VTPKEAARDAKEEAKAQRKKEREQRKRHKQIAKQLRVSLASLNNVKNVRGTQEYAHPIRFVFLVWSFVWFF